MSRGVNKAILVGHLGADPETRNTPSGAAVANLRLATSEQWTDKQSGEKKERTEWHRVVAWGRLAEICAQYMRKGQLVYVEGSIETRKWTDSDGNDRYSTEIRARDIQMLGGKGEQRSSEPRREQPAQADSFDDDNPF